MSLWIMNLIINHIRFPRFTLGNVGEEFFSTPLKYSVCLITAKEIYLSWNESLESAREVLEAQFIIYKTETLQNPRNLVAKNWKVNVAILQKPDCRRLINKNLENLVQLWLVLLSTADLAMYCFHCHFFLTFLGGSQGSF